MESPRGGSAQIFPTKAFQAFKVYFVNIFQARGRTGFVPFSFRSALQRVWDHLEGLEAQSARRALHQRSESLSSIDRDRHLSRFSYPFAGNSKKRIVALDKSSAAIFPWNLDSDRGLSFDMLQNVATNSRCSSDSDEEPVTKQPRLSPGYDSSDSDASSCSDARFADDGSYFEVRVFDGKLD